ncbi:F-type H+-transporting ATPase subunit J [Tremella mesenterica]|uniref:F-type H+-transporting ATPase subunit J n=1 Tax=Tremella mesenterica TaxID=5217 RepID=A0A4Q1BB19_TREME|nr:F-type H+-transporting ATPase subunit J [Tremella mesenterica]
MFGLRAWPTPILKPLWPFAVGAAITFFGVVKLQDVALQDPEMAKNPKNPYALAQAKANGHH